MGAALIDEGNPVAAVVINPVRDEVFEATRDGGAFCNGRRLSIDIAADAGGARFAVPETFTLKKLTPTHWPDVQFVRANSGLYRLALIANGSADASFATVPKWEWDLAPGVLLVAEAGGVVSGLKGEPLTFNTAEARVPGFIAARPGLHGLVLDRINAS